MVALNTDPLIARRRSIRQTALLGAPAPLADVRGMFGPAVLPLTPWHFLLLQGYANPLFCGGIPRLADVLQYLWLCSPEFWHLAHDARGDVRTEYSRMRRQWRAFRFWRFRQNWRKAVSVPIAPGRRGPSQRALDAIREHSAQILIDRPKPVPRKKGQPAPPIEPVETDGVHELAALYYLCRRTLGYSDREFWRMPCAVTNQLLVCATRSRPSDPNVPTFDPELDRSVGEYLRAKKRRAAAAVAASKPSAIY